VDVAIRRAGDRDVAQLAAIHVASWRAAYRGLVAERVIAELSAPGREVAWRETIAAQGAAGAQRAAGAGDAAGARVWTLVAERAGGGGVETGNGLVGFCSVAAPSRDRDAGGVVGEIAALYVGPEWWRAGVGSALLAAGLAALERAGFGEVSLWVLAGNVGAERFYKGFGFGRDGGEQVHERSGVTELRLRRRGCRPGLGETALRRSAGAGSGLRL
jgi:ribosomal protein S18 acetylase RimI-like enzyme